MREVFPAMTLLQRRAIQRRLMRHLHGQDTPVRASTVGSKCVVPTSYSIGAPGWTVRILSPIRIPSRNETRLSCPPSIRALIGTVVDGTLFSPGVPENLDSLKSNEDDEEDAAD